MVTSSNSAGGPAVGSICPTSFVNPDTMQVVSVAHHSCDLISFTGAPNVALDVTQNPGGVSIRVERTDPATHEVTLGPVLMTLEEWNWGHSGTPVAGDGSVWVYGYDANASQLLELSATTGRLEHRFRLDAGLVPDPAVNSDGFWIDADGVWAGAKCSAACALYHIGPGSDRISVALRAGIADQWFVASGNGVFADVMTQVKGGIAQTIWRLDGGTAHRIYATPADLLPAPNFDPGYVAIGTAQGGLYTLSELASRGHTPAAIGECKSGTPVRVVRIDLNTGKQSYVATLPQAVLARDCSGNWLLDGQAAVHNGSMYLPRCKPSEESRRRPLRPTTDRPREEGQLFRKR